MTRTDSTVEGSSVITCISKGVNKWKGGYLAGWQRSLSGTTWYVCLPTRSIVLPHISQFNLPWGEMEGDLANWAFDDLVTVRGIFLNIFKTHIFYEILQQAGFTVSASISECIDPVEEAFRRGFWVLRNRSDWRRDFGRLRVRLAFFFSVLSAASGFRLKDSLKDFIILPVRPSSSSSSPPCSRFLNRNDLLSDLDLGKDILFLTIMLAWLILFCQGLLVLRILTLLGVPERSLHSSLPTMEVARLTNRLSTLSPVKEDVSTYLAEWLMANICASSRVTVLKLDLSVLQAAMILIKGPSATLKTIYR